MLTDPPRSPTTQSSVGAGLLANRVNHLATMLSDPPRSPATQSPVGAGLLANRVYQPTKVLT